MPLAEAAQDTIFPGVFFVFWSLSKKRQGRIQDSPIAKAACFSARNFIQGLQMFGGWAQIRRM